MTMQKLTVYEDGHEISYSFDDLLKFHGPGFPGGVTHAYKVMERAFPLLAPDGYLERKKIAIDTSFGGPGGRDSFEMVTRVDSRGKYNVDKSLGDRWEGDGNRRHYFFRLHYEDRSVDLIIKPGHLRDEFFSFPPAPEQTDDQKLRVAWLKQEMTTRLMALDARAIYDVLNA
tara:strand:- start:163 stop:678 length:516 start_codon:yes stop_codon:yes gene_type:complete